MTDDDVNDFTCALSLTPDKRQDANSRQLLRESMFCKEDSGDHYVT